MKSILSILFLLVLAVPLSAQTWDEWFNQNKTQRKYLLNQIVRLQLYLGYVKKGNNIMNTGLSAIGTIKKGDFQLHDLFINDKKRVKAVIKNSFDVLEIIQVANQVRQYWSSIHKFISTASFTPEEKEYLLGVKFNLLEDLSMDIQRLLDVITSGKLEMSDQERIERISVIRMEVVNKKIGTKSTANSLRVLVNQKNRSSYDLKQLEELCLLPNHP